MPVLRTTCNRDCPDVCTIEVHKDDSGRAIRLKGASDDPITRGFLCERTNRFLERQYADDRLTQPLWRRHKGAPLEPVSWGFALDLCAEKLQSIKAEFGPQAIFHYRSGGSLGMLKKLGDLLFEKFGPVALKHGDICSGAGEAAQELDFGVCESHDLFDLENSKTIVNWGKNIHTSGVHLLPVLVEARRRGSKVITVDCVRTRSASISDCFIQPRPGTDHALALGALALILVRGQGHPDPASFCDGWDEFRSMAMSRTPDQWAAMAGVALSDLEILADGMANGPAAILVGWGLARRRFGGAAVRFLDALSAVTGNLGVAGGGVSYYFRRRFAFDDLVKGREVAPRSFSEACMGVELLKADPPVKAMWITAGNPATMLPDSETVRRALLSIDFLVVVDTHPTDTTDLADLVLPTLTLLEDDDLLGAYGNHFLRVSCPTVEPAGEARHELWIWQQLANRLGLGPELAGTPREWKERMMERLAGAGVTLEQLEAGPVRSPFAAPVLFVGLRFPTPSGKMQLIRELPPESGVDPEFPLTLMAVSTPKGQASQWSVAPPEVPEVRVHPSTGFEDRQKVTVETRQGSLPAQVVLDDSVHPSVAVMAKGQMARQGGRSNGLVRAEETDIGGGAAYYDEPVRLVSAAP